MSKPTSDPNPSATPQLAAMLADGRARAGSGRLAAVLAQIGPRTGPVTDAGTRALDEQRGDGV